MRVPLGVMVVSTILSLVWPPGQAGAVGLRVAVRVVPSGIEDRLATGVLRELVSVWKRCGVEVLAYTDGLEPQPVTTVSLVLSPGWPPADASGGLGWIRFVTNPVRTPAPVLMVSLAATRALVEAAEYRGTHVTQRPLALRRELTARALGRAAAHELGHYLLASREHAARGLMRARFSSDELVSDDGAAFRLEAPERVTVAARLRDARFLSEQTLPSANEPRPK